MQLRKRSFLERKLCEFLDCIIVEIFVCTIYIANQRQNTADICMQSKAERIGRALKYHIEEPLNKHKSLAVMNK